MVERENLAQSCHPDSVQEEESNLFFKSERISGEDVGRAELPDFSWYKIPKRYSHTKMTTKGPHGHKVYKMAVK
jgi:hypothetical protein